MGEEEEPEEMQQKRMEAMQQEQEQRKALLTLLEPDAYSRLANVRISNPALFRKIVQLLYSLAQAGQLKGRLGEAQLKALLVRMTAGKPTGSISVKRK